MLPRRLTQIHLSSPVGKILIFFLEIHRTLQIELMQSCIWNKLQLLNKTIANIRDNGYLSYATECPRMNAIVLLGRPRERCAPEDKLVLSCGKWAGEIHRPCPHPWNWQWGYQHCQAVSHLSSFQFGATDLKVLCLYN